MCTKCAPNVFKCAPKIKGRETWCLTKVIFHGGMRNHRDKLLGNDSEHIDFTENTIVPI